MKIAFSISGMSAGGTSLHALIQGVTRRSRIDGSIVDRVKFPSNTEFLALNKGAHHRDNLGTRCFLDLMFVSRQIKDSASSVVRTEAFIVST